MITTVWDYFHSIGFHFYTIPALVLLLTVTLIMAVHWLNDRRRDGDHEDRLSEIREELADENGGIR